jgi:hypothetical protein
MQIAYVIFHWIWAAVFAILLLSGLAMTGARFGWLLQYDITTADFVHRVFAAFYVLLTFLMIAFEAARVLVNGKNLPWAVFGSTGYGRFTLLTTMMFILSGVVLWGNHEQNKAALAFSMFVHEKLTYFVLLSLIWHIYQEAHALIWPNKAPASVGPLTVAGLINQPWAKLAMWLIASSFFFAMAVVAISTAAPPPGEQQVSRFMQGMMKAMDQSLMGVAAMETGSTRMVMEYSSVLLIGALILVLAVIALGPRKEDPR